MSTFPSTVLSVSGVKKRLTQKALQGVVDNAAGRRRPLAYGCNILGYDTSKLRRVASCIRSYADLVEAFQNATGQDSPSFQLCEGTIPVGRTLVLNASGASLSCAGSAETCILEKDPAIVGRILRILGNGASISGITFKDGQSVYGGGAVSVTGTDGFGPVIIEDCAFVGNSAGRDGGALKITRHGCSVKILNSRFTGNVATSFGGAISILENDIMCRSVSSSRNLIACPLEISGSSFQSNQAGYGGGAVHSNYYVCQSGNDGYENAASVMCSDFFLRSYSNMTCYNIMDSTNGTSPTTVSSTAPTPSPTLKTTSLSSACSSDSWPTCSNTPLTGTDCQSLIESQCPSLYTVIVAYDAFVTEDYRTDRVRIFVKNGYVYSTPVIG